MKTRLVLSGLRDITNPLRDTTLVVDPTQGREPAREQRHLSNLLETSTPRACTLFYAVIRCQRLSVLALLLTRARTVSERKKRVMT